MFQLTKREEDIMNILWMAERSLTASEIAKSKEKLSINTVQAGLKKLMEKELIEVDQVVYSGTVLCRSYKPRVSLAEFEARRLAHYFSQSKNKMSMSCFVASFLGQEEDDKHVLADIEALEDLLNKKKWNLRKRESRFRKEPGYEFYFGNCFEYDCHFRGSCQFSSFSFEQNKMV